MKGILFDIKRFAVHDGPGIRTTVFFKGCPLHCLWCHNPESIAKNPGCIQKTVQLNGHKFTDYEMVGYETTSEQLMTELVKEQVFMEESGGGVTFSGGEPLMQDQFLIEMLQLCKNHGMHTTVDTSLFAFWRIIQAMASTTDLFLIDVKMMDDRMHMKYTGVSNQLILQNIEKLAAFNKAYCIRIPMVPGISMTTENIDKTIRFLCQLDQAPLSVDLLPFHRAASEKYKRFQKSNHFADQQTIKKEELYSYKKQLEQAGFSVKIGG